MRLERVNGMEFDAYDLVRQISNTYCELATLKETHGRSLQIIEEKRDEIHKLKGQYSCLDEAHDIAIALLDEKLDMISALEQENADLKKQIAELKGAK
jgi:chromosome segregation ATPase